MSIEGLLIALILTGGVILLVGIPWLRHDTPKHAHDAQIARQYDRARVYYERVLRNLRDLDEDRALGKVSPEEYSAERAIWSQRGVEVLKTLDRLAAGQLVVAEDADEAAVTRRKVRTHGTTSCWNAWKW